MLVAMWSILGPREDTTNIHLFMLITGLPAVILMFMTWLVIVRRR
jgi:hypothetical protein